MLTYNRFIKSYHGVVTETDQEFCELPGITLGLYVMSINQVQLYL